LIDVIKIFVGMDSIIDREIHSIYPRYFSKIVLFVRKRA